MKVANRNPHFDRELGADDLKKVGVEGFRKTLFPINEAVEVSDEVGAALIENDLLFGASEEVTEEDEVKVETSSKASDAKASSDDPVNGSESSQESTTPKTPRAQKAATA